ncbi:transcriptional regulator [Bacteroidetes bacterium UKL13-3]|jgi:two-component system alkaline phosphatase synthesis response regulator PhoP|nr:transcriptional regulator [Bacteroidetes bacterium UKL13-3]HCP94653.1 DNA-binding response regulator [Bacteroidota bacterium]
MHRILLVEDEEHLQHALKLNLEMENYTVFAVGDGNSAVKAFREQKFDLVVLDIMLPEMDGLMVCEHIRLHDSDVPVLFLSAKNTPADRINGLRKGADDYLTKPFDLEELILRVGKLIEKKEKLIKSESGKLPTEYAFGDNTINFESYEAQGINGKIELTKKEILLMKLLIENTNQVVSREHILKVVWDYTVIPNTRTIDNFILSLRKHFERDPKNPEFIQSVRGVGYKFVA